MLFRAASLLAILAAVPLGFAQSGMVTSFNGPFQVFVQFDDRKALEGYHLTSAPPSTKNQGLIMSINGSPNPGNLAQYFTFTNGSLITSYSAVDYGSRATYPADTGYPLAPLMKGLADHSFDYLTWMPGATPETRLAFQPSKKFPGPYELVWNNGSSLPLVFDQAPLGGRWSGVIYAQPGDSDSRTVTIMTYGPSK